jgi:hypothetical protein
MRPNLTRGLKTALYGVLILTSAACGVRRPYVAQRRANGAEPRGHGLAVKTV